VTCVVDRRGLESQEGRRENRGRRLSFGRRLGLTLLVVLTFSAGAATNHLVVQPHLDAGASSSLTDLPEFETLQQTWDLIHNQYVDESAIDDRTLIYGAAKGMVDSLGDTGHSSFLTPEEAESFRAQQQGRLIGIGVQMDFTGARPVIIAPIDGGPADRAGVQAGDIILEIDGQSTEGMSELQVRQLVRGDAGTEITLTLQRASDQTIYTVTLTRERIKLQLVSWAMLPNDIAMIRLGQFSAGAARAVRGALEEAKAAGARAVIFDLRNNPGGLVFEAIGVASQFLPEGSVIYQLQERGSKPWPVLTVGPGAGQDLPLVVLVNKGSASAAEIVAVAMRDNGRAEVVGERTFGTGTVLSPILLEDGSMLVLGTGLWLTPKGEQMWHKGVEPTITIELEPGVEPLNPFDDANVSTAELEASGDTQVRQAVGLLSDALSGDAPDNRPAAKVEQPSTIEDGVHYDLAPFVLSFSWLTA